MIGYVTWSYKNELIIQRLEGKKKKEYLHVKKQTIIFSNVGEKIMNKPEWVNEKDILSEREVMKKVFEVLYRIWQ